MALTRKQLQWTEEDDKILAEYFKDIDEGRSRVIDITRMSAQELRNVQPDDPRFMCGKCYCHNEIDGRLRQCDCPCHSLKV